MLKVIKTQSGLELAYPDQGSFKLSPDGKRVSSWTVRPPNPAELRKGRKFHFAIKS